MRTSRHGGTGAARAGSLLRAGAARGMWSTVVPLAVGAWLLWRVRAPGDTGGAGAALSPVPGHDPRAGSTPAPGALTVSVVVPARDEELALPGLLASLGAQTRRPDELIVVDDHSVDATAALAVAGGARVVVPPPLPDGWVGKTWACHHGAAGATGDVLVFLDADVTLGPDALARLLDEHGRAGGLVSVQPSHRTERLHEQLSAVCNVVAMMGTGAFTGPPARRPDMAFGPCLLLDRFDYHDSGGHAHPTVRLRVAEDIALARRMRALGRPVEVLAGGDIVSFRMYPDGLGQLADGWTKMLADGARRTSLPVALAVFVWVTGALLGARRAVPLLAALLGRRRWRSVAVDAVAYGAWVGEMAWLFGRVGRWRRLTAVGFPAPLVAFVVLLARSAALLVRRRPARWRGRAVPVG